jgi:hypothetical protein
VSKDAVPAHGAASLAVSPWTLRGVLPALGRSPALRGHPGGIDAAGPGRPGLAAGGERRPPGPVSASVDAPRADARTGAGGRSVWQRSQSAWRAAGLEWPRQAAWNPADDDLQRTEPIPVVSAPVAPVDVAAASAVPPDLPWAAGALSTGARPARPVLAVRGGRSLRRGRRTVVVGAVVCIALFATVVAGIVIAGPRGVGPGHGPTGLVVAYPPARLADGQFAGPGGAPAPVVPPSLTAIAAAGRTVVAVGSQATLPVARPLVLMSPDGGRTWQSAALHAPRGDATAGAVPLMVAGGQGRWLALGPDAVWTSTDGRSWQLGPGIAPLVSGDRVLALARTSGGYVAVGKNLHPHGSDVVRTPVLWMSTNGLTWQRWGPSQLDLPAGKARVVALRWAAAHGGTLMIAGAVTRIVVRHHGKRKVRFVNETRAVWRSRDNGAHWWRANPPVNRRATGRLTGLAATGSGFVAIRPGHASRHARAAVAYVWGHGSTWRYAGKLKARRRASLYVSSIAGSDQGVVVTATIRHHRVALVSTHGRSWRRAADLGRSSANAITGATVGPGGKVVAAGRSRRGSFLLARGHRLPVGQAALAATAAAGVSVNGLGVGPAAQAGVRHAGQAGVGPAGQIGVDPAGQIAVGHADGKPAVWTRPPGGRWARATVAVPPSWQGTGPGLTTVVHGGAGWLAVGDEGGGAAQAEVGAVGTLESATAAQGGQQPVLATSPDGWTWRPAAGAGSVTGPGLTLTGAAAGPSGYVVTGVRNDQGRPVAALWWSADLATWAPQGSWTGAVPDGDSSALLAVAAGRTGFAAVGALGTHPAVWLSRDGQEWRMRPLALPAGAGSAVLQRVAVQGRRITALGVQARSSGPVPFGAVSVDGGGTWREISLPRPGGSALVTALVTVGKGFLATGTLGGGGTQDVIAWWSRNGIAWHAVRPAGTWRSVPGAQQITGLSASGNVITGVGYATTGTGRHPVLWQARVR